VTRGPLTYRQSCGNTKPIGVEAGDGGVDDAAITTVAVGVEDDVEGDVGETLVGGTWDRTAYKRAYPATMINRMVAMVARVRRVATRTPTPFSRSPRLVVGTSAC